jgi:hypothetical protein
MWREDVEDWLAEAIEDPTTWPFEEACNRVADILRWENALDWLDRATARGMAQPDEFRGRFC